MNLKLIACKVLSREFSLMTSRSSNVIDIAFLQQDFHNQPEQLRVALQEAVDAVEQEREAKRYSMFARAEDYDAVLLGYGLCSNAVVGIRSGRYPIVVPRAHDCITLLLGCRHRYRRYFDEHPGTYWYTRGWTESTLMPGRERRERIYQQYVEKYGEENADFLMQTEQDWLSRYNRCTLIRWPGIPAADPQQQTREAAEYLNWTYDEIEGEQSLVEDFLEGRWDSERFLVVQPGQTIVPSYDGGVIAAQ